MAKPVIFGIFQFRTKKAATEEIRSRINSYEEGDRLKQNDQIFFEELFKLHDGYIEKIGAGIQYIEVERDFHNNRCLYIHRVDGTKIDISWVHCVRPASTKSTVSMAFRRVVKVIVTSFKSQCLSEGVTCPVLGIMLDFKNSHVSYIERSFDSILREFLTESCNTYASIELENPKPEDADQRGMVKDRAIKEAWVIFHNQNAKLELWSAEANLRKPS